MACCQKSFKLELVFYTWSTAQCSHGGGDGGGDGGGEGGGAANWKVQGMGSIGSDDWGAHS